MSAPDDKSRLITNEAHAGNVRIGLLAIAFMALMAVAIHELIALWPTVVIKTVTSDRASISAPQWEVSTVYGWWITWQLATEQRALWLIVLSGVVGSCVHVLTSLATYVGNRRFFQSWTLWYLVRPLIGAGLAFLIVSVIWGGIAAPSQGFNGSNPYQLVAVAGLAGMFSRTASDKLQEIFDQLFKSKLNEERGDDVTEKSRGV